MTWIIHEVYGRFAALHQHGDSWAEAYGEKFQCGECNEAHPSPHFVRFANVVPRPNSKVYWVLDKRYRVKETKIRVAPSKKVEEWDDFGHVHGPGSWQPISYKDFQVCPNCLESSPKTYSALPSVQDVTLPFMAKVKDANGEHDIKVQIY